MQGIGDRVISKLKMLNIIAKIIQRITVKLEAIKRIFSIEKNFFWVLVFLIYKLIRIPPKH